MFSTISKSLVGLLLMWASLGIAGDEGKGKALPFPYDRQPCHCICVTDFGRQLLMHTRRRGYTYELQLDACHIGKAGVFGDPQHRVCSGLKFVEGRRPFKITGKLQCLPGIGGGKKKG